VPAEPGWPDGSRLPLERGPEAMARMESGEQFGKIVLIVGD
jgi:hypothetical protein